MATGETHDLEDVDIFSRKRAREYIITQQALAEGWDCSFAYVLASVAELRSETRVEQLLGRILRAAGRDVARVGGVESLVCVRGVARFWRDSECLARPVGRSRWFRKGRCLGIIAAGNQAQSPLDLPPTRHAEIRPVVVQLPEKPDLKKLDATLRKKVEWDAEAQTLTITKPIAPEEDAAIAQTVVWQESQTALAEAALKSRTMAVEIFKTPSERGLAFRVPQLAVRVHGELQLFDDPEVLDYPWDLPAYASTATADELSRFHSADRVAEGGAIDVEKGKMLVTFLPELERDSGVELYTGALDGSEAGRLVLRSTSRRRLHHAAEHDGVRKRILNNVAQSAGRRSRAGEPAEVSSSFTARSEDTRVAKGGGREGVSAISFFRRCERAGDSRRRIRFCVPS